MADLATTRRQHALGLTDRERRERVVQQEALARLRHQPVDDLLGVRARQGDDAEGLRLPAGEQHGAVHARQHADLNRDGTDRLRIAAVSAHALVEDRLALALLDQVPDDLADLLVVRLRLGLAHARRSSEVGDRVRLGRLDGCLPDLLDAERQRGSAQRLAVLLLDLRLELGVSHGSFELHLRLAGLLSQLFDHLDDLLDDLVRLREGLEDDVLLHLFGAGLHHHDRVRVARDSEVELVRALRREGGVSGGQ